jgi:nitronate monooxygenase
MNFGTDREAKAWRDIWGSGQGIGAIDRIPTAGELVERLTREYAAARDALLTERSPLRQIVSG